MGEPAKRIADADATPPPSSSPPRPPLGRQLARFMAVGVFAMAAHYAALVGLVEFAAWPAVAATTIGALIGSLVGYTLNRRYTFDIRPAFARGLLKHIAATGVAIVINANLLALFVHALHIYYLPAQLLTTTLVAIWNFTAARYLVFR